MAGIKADVQELLDDIARSSRGPGGAIAVIQEGEVIAQRVWGFANLEKRIPFTADTVFPICSITKQFVCGLLLDLERNPPANVAAKGDLRQQLNHHLKEILPKELTKNGELIENGYLTLEHLCDMQSGLRDFRPMSALWGTKPEDEFLIERDAPLALARTKSFHFEPGTEYAYCNLNFHIITRVIEGVTGESLDKLLQERILGPAGMKTASLCPNTADYPATCVGYEGSEKLGFVASVNRMQWSGDAGLVMSLNDMVAYEKYLDRCHSDPESWYRAAIADPPKFKDGSPAPYRYGLVHSKLGDVEKIGHSGGLRGYGQTRVHVPVKHLSVAVAVNSDVSIGATMKVLRKILNVPKPEPGQIQPNEKWFGAFLDESSQLSVVVAKGSRDGVISLTYDGELSDIRLTTENHAQSDNITAKIDGDSLTMVLRDDHRTFTAQRLVPNESLLKDTTTFQGVYKCLEVESTFHCIGHAGTLYGAFDGYLGEGPAAPMRYLGADVWVLTCPRGLDMPGPGDWTVSFRRNEDSAVDGFIIGIPLARGIVFKKA